MTDKKDRKWTAEQLAVIETRGCNLLVSAAAGSGKTAVLVERIIEEITRGEHPLDIDRLLVVTFTSAAAAEMRERIVDALQARLEEDPENEHLIRQSSLVHQAMIMTIHSFCLDVIREHALTIGIDPSFRVASESECELLRINAMETLLEEMYAEPTDSFTALEQTYASGKSDTGLGRVIRQFYDYSLAYPDPGLWRKDCAAAYSLTDLSALNQAEWMRDLLEDVRKTAADMKSRLENAMKLCLLPEGPGKYIPELEAKAAQLSAFAHAETFDDFVHLIGQADIWDRSAVIRTKSDREEELKNRVKAVRDQVKEELGKLHERYFFCSGRETLAVMDRCRDCAEELARLADRYGEIYTALKEEAGAADFSDLEHLALRVLVSYDAEGNALPEPPALSYRERFCEVMTDEYQDSNLVQEMILWAVSAGNNRFMVGDVKQSIYRFRLARPEMFMEKYKTYAAYDAARPGQGEGVRIELSRNFRSRRQVLETVNMIFTQIMGEDLGGIAYDEAAALHTGACFPQEDDPSFTPQLLLVKEGYQEDDVRFGELKEQEALAVARQIRAMVGVQQVTDTQTGTLRPVCYDDIAILLRTMKGWGDVFLSAMHENGIPAVCDVSDGFFDATEVRTVLDMLELVDNPRQDIPLAAVLLSPIGELSADDLVRIRAASPQTDFYTACIAYGGEESDLSLRERLSGFFRMLEMLRDEAVYTPVHELIWRILDLTDYLACAQALPGGEIRKDNLTYLVSLAADYEENNYRSVFYFLRYMEKLQEANIDFPGSGSGAGKGTGVRILSIHKSKGLEYPVVFVSGLGKMINQRDSYAPLVLHPLMGMGVDCLDADRRIKLPVLLKQVIGRRMKTDTLGEELRILYVAMTRAREKLILTGALPGGGGKMEEYLSARISDSQDERLLLPQRLRAGAQTYLDLLLPALLRHPCADDLLGEYGIRRGRTRSFFIAGGLDIRVVSCSDEEESVSLPEEKHPVRVEDILQDQVYDPETAAFLRKRLKEKTRDTRGDWQIPAKVSVSYLKAAAYDPEQDGARLFLGNEEKEKTGPSRRAEGELSGALRGTLVHRVMEELDFAALQSDKDSDIKSFVRLQLESLTGCGKITSSERMSLREEEFVSFLRSGTGKRMRAAAAAGKLHRETPFVLGVSADTLDPSYHSDVPVLVQGIIDAWFEEEDGLTLLDYKTDYVDTDTDPRGDLLISHYRVQLDLYREALERLTCRSVREVYIYSFCLGRELRLF